MEPSRRTELCRSVTLIASTLSFIRFASSIVSCISTPLMGPISAVTTNCFEWNVSLKPISYVFFIGSFFNFMSSGACLRGWPNFIFGWEIPLRECSWFSFIRREYISCHAHGVSFETSHSPSRDPPQGPLTRPLAHLVMGQIPPVLSSIHLPQSEHLSSNTLSLVILARNKLSLAGKTGLSSYNSTAVWGPPPQDITIMQAALSIASLRGLSSNFVPRTWQPDLATKVPVTSLPSASRVSFIALTSGSPPVPHNAAHSEPPKRKIL